MTTPADFPFQQFIKEFPRGVFEDEVENAFGSGRQTFSNQQRNLLGTRFNDFENQFAGFNVNRANQQQLPTVTFQDYLRGLNPNEQFYNRFNSPQSRNAFNTRNPFTRFRFG